MPEAIGKEHGSARELAQPDLSEFSEPPLAGIASLEFTDAQI